MKSVAKTESCKAPSPARVPGFPSRTCQRCNLVLGDLEPVLYSFFFPHLAERLLCEACCVLAFECCERQAGVRGRGESAGPRRTSAAGSTAGQLKQWCKDQ